MPKASINDGKDASKQARHEAECERPSVALRTMRNSLPYAADMMPLPKAD